MTLSTPYSVIILSLKYTEMHKPQKIAKIVQKRCTVSFHVYWNSCMNCMFIAIIYGTLIWLNSVHMCFKLIWGKVLFVCLVFKHHGSRS